MHGNAGNKIEGLAYANSLIPAGMDLFTFDFSGCGNSDGAWVTLGWKEREDLRAVLQHLKDHGRTSKVALWGRSMGGATALMYDIASAPLPISSLVVDSAFADFGQIASHMVIEKMGLPKEFLDMMWPQVVMNIKSQTGGMDLDNLKPVESVPNVKLPALFVHGIDDELIPLYHT